MEPKFYRELLDAIADGIYFMDTDRTISFWNKAAERLTGYTADEVIGRNCMDNLLRHVDDEGNELCVGRCPMTATMEDGRICEASVYLHHKLGHRVPVRIRSSPMRDEAGTIVGAVEVFSDNSRNLDVLKEMESLRQEVLADPLTGVGNRRYADLTLEDLSAAMSRRGVRFGVLFVDVDNFKMVNDTWGHQVGDRALSMTALTLKNVVRPLDRVCRWGGDEFVVLVPNTTAEELNGMAARLNRMIEKTWLDLEEGRLAVTVSVGGAVSRPGETPAEVVARADGQTYQCKQCGRNCVSIDGQAA